MAVKGLRNLCTPSYIYLVVSVIALVVMMYQNMGNVDKYCLGSYSCNVSSTAMIFIIKAVYILFWTWVLNLICKAGATGVAWFVLLLPLILLFVLLAGMMFYENSKEGFKEGASGSYTCSGLTTEAQCGRNSCCSWDKQFTVCEPNSDNTSADCLMSH